MILIITTTITNRPPNHRACWHCVPSQISSLLWMMMIMMMMMCSPNQPWRLLLPTSCTSTFNRNKLINTLSCQLTSLASKVNQRCIRNLSTLIDKLPIALGTRYKAQGNYHRTLDRLTPQDWSLYKYSIFVNKSQCVHEFNIHLSKPVPQWLF